MRSTLGVLVGVGDFLLLDAQVVHGLGELFVRELFRIHTGVLLDLLRLLLAHLVRTERQYPTDEHATSAAAPTDRPACRGGSASWPEGHMGLFAVIGCPGHAPGHSHRCRSRG